jgi:hypothetical protein
MGMALAIAWTDYILVMYGLDSVNSAKIPAVRDSQVSATYLNNVLQSFHSSTP